MLNQIKLKDATNVSSIDSGGLFSQYAQNPLFSAVIGLEQGFEAELPVVKSMIRDPRVKIITGISDVQGTVSQTCGRYPRSGKFKVCHINDYPMGKYAMYSDTIDMSEVGFVDNDWTNQGQTIVGNPMGSNMRDMSPAQFNQYSNIAKNSTSKLLSELAFSLPIYYGRQSVYGNPANNDPANSDVEEMKGLDILINDNYSDAVTGADCDRIDSIVQDMSGLTIENDTTVIVKRFVDIIATLEQRVLLMSSGTQTRWDGYVAMHFNMFRVLVQAWPSTYYSYRQALNTSNTAFWQGRDLDKDMKDMLNGRYLITDRGNIKVICDPAIVEGTGAVGAKSGDIYFINKSFGGQRTSYVEHYDFSDPRAAAGVIAITRKTPHQVRDGGRFLVWQNWTNTCTDVVAMFRPRLRIDTPYLCARMDNVEYSPDLLIQETPFPTDLDYIGGGVTGPYAGAKGTVATITACADVAAGQLDLTLDNQFDWTLDNTVYVSVGDTRVPAKATAIDNTAPYAPIVTVDFTDAAVTPAFYNALTCADLTFVGGQLITPYQEQ